MDQWELGDLYNIVIARVAERQREGKLSKDWTSVQSFNGDKLFTLHEGARPVKGGKPYIIIFDDRQPPPRYEAHKYQNAKMGFVEITGHCDAADPKFFDMLLNNMIGIQTCEALMNWVLRMNANPDLADIIITYIKDIWPFVDARKLEADYEDGGIHSIEVNGHVVGITCYGVFATWNFERKIGEHVKPTDPNFFEFVKYWAKLKAGLSDPKTSPV